MFLFQVNGTTEWLYTSTTILLLGLGTLLAFGAWAYYLVKREKKPFGEIFNVMLVHQNESILVAVTLLIFFAEAVLAATVHPPGEIPPPPFARFISHLAISIVGITANVTLMKQFARVFEPKIDAVSRFARVLLTGSLFLMATGIPLANCVLISAGLGQDLKLELFLMSWNPFVTSYELSAVIQKFGGDPTQYRPWAAMSYAMKTTVVMTVLHTWVGVIMGLYNLASQERRKEVMSNPYAPKDEKKDDKKDKKTDEEKRKEREERKEYEPMEGEKRADEESESNLIYLLRRMRYEGSDLDKMVKLASKAHYSMANSGERIRFAARIAAMRDECETFDKKKGSLGEAEKSAQAAVLRKKIRVLFESSPSAAKERDRGLGITLQGKKS